MDAFSVRSLEEVETVSKGSSLKLCLIAEGKADVYPRFAPTIKWDTAAGQIIIEEAGGVLVEAESGLPLIYNKPTMFNPYFIASGKII